MALRQLIVSKKIEALRADLKKNEEARAELEQRRSLLLTREAETEAALNEVTDETPEEDRQTVEAEAEQILHEGEALQAEEDQNAEARASLEQQIEQLQAELAELQERAKTPAPVPVKTPTERKDDKNMNTRAFFNMTMEQRDALFAREDVKDFAKRTRELAMQKRAISGADLLIPDVLLGVIREQTAENSKLLKHVNHRFVSGTSRVIVAGAIPEGVWTEMCAKLNELNLGFYGDEMDGYKVGGYIAICNAILEDSDINLVTEIVTALSKAIGMALDKAILYGTGVKMPLGIVTRLAQTEQPADYSAKARPWVDLHATNLQSITGKTGIELFKEIALVAANASNKHASGGKFWAMSEATKTKLVVESASINASGAIVTGTQNVMPLAGGTIETLEFIPEGIIIGGYGELYFVAERAGTRIAQSEHVRFTDDETVFKGTARYDGKPIIAEGFVGIGIGGDAPAASDVTFAADTAN